MAAQTAREMLGFNEGSPMDHATQVQGLDNIARQTSTGKADDIVRVSGEHSDQHYPGDKRRGGDADKSSTITPPHTLDADTVHDGNLGRGPGKKTVDSRYDNR